MTQLAIIGIDIGSKQSGVVVLVDGSIKLADNIGNDLLMGIIKGYISIGMTTTVLIEDIRPYTLKLTNDVITTCKEIGALEWQLKCEGVAYHLIARYSVKEWAYNRFNKDILDAINKKIAYKSKRNNDGKHRAASFVWVDDRIIVMAMKILWKIPKPTPGRKSMYGLSSHSWQALALCSYFISK